MPALRAAGALLFVLVLALPSAMAAQTEGTLQIEGALALEGPIHVAADDATLVFKTLPALRITAERVDLERFVRIETNTPATPLIGTNGADEPERAQHGRATITITDATDGFVLVMNAATLDARTVGETTLRPVEGVRPFSATPAAHADGCVTDAPCHERRGVHELTTTRLDGDLAGDALLYLYGASLRVEDASGITTYHAGERDTQQGLQHETAFLAVRLTGAAGAFRADQPASTYAEAPRIDANGFRAPIATGTLGAGLKQYHAAQDRLDVRGVLQLAPLAPAAGSFGRAGAPAYGTTFDLQVQGDVAQINLAAAPVFADSPREAAGLATLLATLLGFIVYYWPVLQFHGTAMLAPLYTRLKQPKLLDNDVRNAIYDIIRENPGIAARSVHRRSAQSWGTVVYHLRQLEAHHFIVSRRFGRSRNFYENHGKYKGMEKQLACLRSPRARTLARCIVTTPGLSQEELALAADLAQPTTSYYVRKLAHAGLVVEAREGRYVRYEPTEDLARYLAISEQTQENAPEIEGAAKA